MIEGNDRTAQQKLVGLNFNAIVTAGKVRSDNNLEDIFAKNDPEHQAKKT